MPVQGGGDIQVQGRRVTPLTSTNLPLRPQDRDWRISNVNRFDCDGQWRISRCGEVLSRLTTRTSDLGAAGNLTDWKFIIQDGGGHLPGTRR